MPRKSKQTKPSPQTERSKIEVTDYEQYLINKISKCQRVVDELENNRIWIEIKEDYEASAKSLDAVWASADVTDPKFKQMQVTKLATETFLSLLPNYRHDLEKAKEELNKFRNPEVITKKDYDDEGIKGTQTISTLQGNAYHS